MMRGMVIDMEEARLHTLGQVKAFLDGTAEGAFRVPKTERYQFIERVLTRFGYAQHGRVNRGVLLRYLERMTGFSRQQVTRLVREYRQGGRLSARHGAPRHAFSRRFTATDVAMLAEVDALHGTVSGPATKKLMERALLLFGDTRFERLAGISVSHLYNLRGGIPYQRTRRHWTKTRPTGVPIGQRRAPQPNGAPGYIRIDSVHQGDQDGVKGVYHINALDCVTQFQLVATCEKISETYLLPVIRQLLEGFPFVILGFHADNGSEYINDQVATLLEKLRIEFIKSRPRHSNDNALAESKNGAVVRKHLGYAHIPVRRTGHRVLCGLPEPLCQFPPPLLLPGDEHGCHRKGAHALSLRGHEDAVREVEIRTRAHQYLKVGITVEHLDALASRLSDTEAAVALNHARKTLFQTISAASRKRA